MLRLWGRAGVGVLLAGLLAVAALPVEHAQAQEPALPTWTTVSPKSSDLDRAVARQKHGPDLVGHDGPMAKADAALVRLYERAQRTTSKREIDALDAGLGTHVSGGQVLVDAVAATSTDALRDDLDRLGLDRGAAAGRVVSGWLPIDALLEAAQLASLRTLRAVRVVTQDGAVTSQGDAAIRADDARSDVGVDGSGIKVGILSDTFDQNDNEETDAAGDVNTGDLPEEGVEILDDTASPSGGPKDEGRALAQIVHDVAPGADLAFHTGFGGTANMATGIDELAAAGSDVIVDDVFYPAAPMFQDGIIAQAADRAVQEQGVAYFSAAGNFARQSYEAPFRPVTEDGRTLHDFDPSDSGQDRFQKITLAPGKTLTLFFQWTDPYGSAGGATPDADLDIGIVNANEQIEGPQEPNTTDPIEVLEFTNPPSATNTTFDLVVELKEGTAPARIKVFWLVDNFMIEEYAAPSATVYGHANGGRVASVGAAAYVNTPEFGADTPEVESFSSEGGTPIYFTDEGVALDEPEVRENPDFVAPDGVDNTFFGASDFDGSGFPNFSGTSAAAPHAAGVAALMLARDPSLTPADLYASLRASAIDMDDPATSDFDTGYDVRTGYGLIQADDAPPLPVELTAFEGQVDGDRIALTWTTASERQNAGFEVQHATGEGAWTAIGFVDGAGTTAEATHYRFETDPLPPGLHRFRLRQIDADGTAHRSEVVTVRRTMRATLRLAAPSPNPVRQRAVIEFGVKQPAEATLELYNVLGQRVQTLYRGTPTPGETQSVTVNAENLPSGAYLLRLRAAGRSVTKQMTVVR